METVLRRAISLHPLAHSKLSEIYGTPRCFAALNTLDEKVIATCMLQHRHQECLKFLRLIDKSPPRRKQLHLIIDNYSPHKHPDVQAWLQKHKRFHLHFTPTSASWLNMVERFFRDLTQKQIRRSCFGNVAELVETIEHYVAQHNSDTKPVWTARASDILEKVNAHVQLFISYDLFHHYTS